MPTHIRPFRMLRHGVGLAVKGVRAGVGGTVRLVWPVNKQKKKHAHTHACFSEHWSSAVMKSPFQSELCEGDNGQCQSLMTVGTRHWGSRWDAKGMLGIKIYDFALYADQKQIRRSQLGRVARTQGAALPRNNSFYRQLRSTKEVDMSIVVKASRNLPLSVMSSEYEKILKRRLQRVGGRTDDPSLPGFLSIFESERLPPHVQDEKKNVKKGQNSDTRKTVVKGVYRLLGATMLFKRGRDGTLSAFAGEQKVGSVKSQDLCSALFDLYLGDEPVSSDAKTLAANRVLNMVLDEGEGKPRTQSIPRRPTRHNRFRPWNLSMM